MSEFAGYRLIATLGRGNTARVYLALKRGTAGFHKMVVLKVLRSDLVGSGEHVTMFLDEARLSARLSHPHLVQTHEIGVEEGRYFIEMEHLAGQTLRSVLQRMGADFPLDARLTVLSRVARALHHAHNLRDYDQKSLEVVHRDVSPQNIFITYDGNVKLLDFGIAKSRTAEDLTQIGMVKGRTNYLSPEQVRGERADHRADVFALGVLLYEAVTGQSFSGDTSVPLVTRLHARVTGGERPVRVANPRAPEALALLVDRAIAIDRNQRPESAEAFADAIDAHLGRSARSSSMASMARLASLLEGPFSDERAMMDALVLAQTADARAAAPRSLGTKTQILPIVEPSSDTVTGLRHEAPSTLQRLPSAALAEAALASGKATPFEATVPGGQGRPASEAPPALSPHAPASVPPGVEPLPSGAPGPLTAPLPSGAQRQSVWRPVATGIGAGAIMVAATFGVLHFRPTLLPWAEQGLRAAVGAAEPARLRDPATLQQAAQAAKPQAGTRSPEQDVAIGEPALVRIRLRLSPRFARVWLDGRPVDHPLDLSLERSTKVHNVVARAPGYETLRRTFDRHSDQDLGWRLRRRLTGGGSRSVQDAQRGESVEAEPVARAIAAPLPEGPMGDSLQADAPAGTAAEPLTAPLPSAESVSDTAPGDALPVPGPRREVAIDMDDPYR